MANALARRVGLGQPRQLCLRQRVACPFPPRAFDAAYMLHVGMNIEDKAKLMAQVRRVLKPGARFGVYRRHAHRRWRPGLSRAVGAHGEDQLRRAARRLSPAAGLRRVRRQTMSATAASSPSNSSATARARRGREGTPPLGLHIVMGKDFQDKTGNMIANLERGLIAPIEMIGRAARRSASSAPIRR